MDWIIDAQTVNLKIRFFLLLLLLLLLLARVKRIFKRIKWLEIIHLSAEVNGVEYWIGKQKKKKNTQKPITKRVKIME